MPESSPAACRFEIRDRTAFCFLLSGLLNIDSALTLISFPGRDDTDGFFFAIFILHAIYVDNQQDRCGSNGVPPLAVPFKSHRYTNCITTKPVEVNGTVGASIQGSIFGWPISPL